METNIEKKPSKVLKFAPVKVLLLESRGEYYRTICCAICVGLSHVLIGATIMVTFIYSLQTGDIHAILCTLGYQFFTSEAILSLSYVNGWSTHLRLSHRRGAHIILQGCAISLVVCGLLTRSSRKWLSSSGHSITGVAACFITLLCIVSGPFGIQEDRCFKYLHIGFGLPTYFLSSVCVCLGFHTANFTSWTNTSVVYILTAFTIFYTLSICTVSAIHGMLHIK